MTHQTDPRCVCSFSKVIEFSVMFAPTNLFAQQKQDTTKKIEAYINGMEEKEAASICQKFYGKRSIPKNKEEFLQKVQDLTNPFMLRHEDAIMKGCRPPSITHSWIVTKKNLDKAEKCLMSMKPDSVKAEDLREVLKQTRSQYLEMDETHENKAAWKLKKKDIQTSCSPFLDSTDVFASATRLFASTTAKSSFAPSLTTIRTTRKTNACQVLTIGCTSRAFCHKRMLFTITP